MVFSPAEIAEMAETFYARHLSLISFISAGQQTMPAAFLVPQKSRKWQKYPLFPLFLRDNKSCFLRDNRLKAREYYRLLLELPS